jgi:hypothetical protein
LNITVTPKQGRALLWPSVLNDRPHHQDERTYHEALPVDVGVKYGANAWCKSPHNKNRFVRHQNHENDDDDGIWFSNIMSLNKKTFCVDLTLFFILSPRFFLSKVHQFDYQAPSKNGCIL